MNIDPDDAAERSARLAEKIKQAMGEGWTQLPGLAGTDKQFEYIDDNVFLTAGNYLFYERPDGELGCAFQQGGRWYEGDWTSGTFEIHSMYPIADPRLN